MRGLSFRDQDPPPHSPTHFHPTALREEPVSDFNIYVMSFLYPRDLVTRQAAEYNMLHAFLVPSVQHRVTSKVQPLSRFLDTGLPTMMTPTTASSLEQAI